jgi:hypothetical protein
MNAMRKPSHLESLLAYYASTSAPGYAVLVTGDWGTGKTTQVNRALSVEDRYYVSLFGAKNADEVHAAVFAAMFPIKAKTRNFLRGIGETGVELPGLGTLSLAGVGSAFANTLLRLTVKADRVIVFDDLERGSLAVREILGVINHYVEHYGCRVVVIAHDDKLADDFKQAKEKIFGRTVRVEAQVEDAYENFVQMLQPPDREFGRSVGDSLKKVFALSEVKSLRVLRHSLDDLLRLRTAIQPDWGRISPLHTELVQLVAALSMEVRSGRLDEGDLVKRGEAHLRYLIRTGDSVPEQPPITKAAARYSATIDVTSRLLPDELITDILIRGAYDGEAIRSSLRSSPKLAERDDVPAWRRFMELDSLAHDELDAVVADLRREFADRALTKSGDILHLFSLRFMLSEEGEIPDSFDKVAADCRAYVDDLGPRIEPLPLHRGDRSSASGGYTFWVTDTFRQHFESIADYMRAARQRALDESLRAVTPDLLRLLESDGEAFQSAISFTGAGTNTYGSVPVLAQIDPKQFVHSWLKSHPRHWHAIAEGLSKRYQGQELIGPLKAEKIWMSEVLKLLGDEVDQASGLRRFRLRRNLPDVKFD